MKVFRPEVKQCFNWYCVSNVTCKGEHANRCVGKFPIPEPSCHLSFSAKSQARNEWFPCPSLLSLTNYHLCFWASSEQLPFLYLPRLFPQWITPSYSKRTNEWVTPGSQYRKEPSSHYLCLFSLSVSLSLSFAWSKLCIWQLTHSTELPLQLHWRLQQWSTTSLCLINMLMVRRRVCSYTQNQWLCADVVPARFPEGSISTRMPQNT